MYICHPERYHHQLALNHPVVYVLVCTLAQPLFYLCTYLITNTGALCTSKKESELLVDKEKGRLSTTLSFLTPWDLTFAAGKV